MSNPSIEEVLSNWIRQANSADGTLMPDGVEPSTWIASQFLNWWRDQGVTSALGDATLAAARVKDELNRLGGFSNAQLGEAMHELTHLNEALDEIRELLGLASDGESQLEQ